MHVGYSVEPNSEESIKRLNVVLKGILSQHLTDISALNHILNELDNFPANVIEVPKLLVILT